MKQAVIIQPLIENNRIQLGISYIERALKDVGYEISGVTEEPGNDYRELEGIKIYVGNREESAYLKDLEDRGLLIYHKEIPAEEGFYLNVTAPKLCIVSGGDATGALYGCLELAERIRKEGKIPEVLAFQDAPVYRLRGPVIGLQKTKLEPPRLTYEYPVTPGRFPWFYDKKLWQEYLDMMLEDRCNVLYIWSGHPFSSFVKVPDYPEALEVTEEEFQKNREVFEWLTKEADRRGIWVVLKFYSIHIPLPFAEKHHLELLQSSINPLVADYTYKSIIEFIKSFPHIGLMVCLGEALRGDQNKEDWFLKTIIPAVNEGIRQADLKEIPPLILRGHDCKAEDIMHKAVKEYSNLYTQWKFNGESLTSYYPVGNWQKKHNEMTVHGQTHIMNVHVLANLEPFRFAAPGFIQKCMQTGMHRLGTSGLHLYPLFFWDWPYAADKTNPRIKQVDRDWMWYKAWMRYAWNPDYEEKTEREYWIGQLDAFFGCGREAGAHILNALEQIGECAPRILRRIGITEGNRQTMSLGMTMSQLTNVKKYRPNYELWKSVSTPGEQPDEYVQRELKGERHFGETPVDMTADVLRFSAEAVREIYKAKDQVTCNLEEFERYITDIEAIRMICEVYAKKVDAAVKVLTYKYTMNEELKGDLSLLEDAAEDLKESLDIYRCLAELTEKTYLYANSMQPPQRKIPFPNGETYGHWSQCLPEYEKEYQAFIQHVEEMKQGIFPKEETDDEQIEPLKNSEFHLLSDNCETYIIEKGASVFTDYESPIQNTAQEVAGLTGIRFGLGEAIESGVTVKVELKEDSLILVGYMNAKGVEWLQVPDLETNTHADDRGGLAVVYGSAIYAEGCPLINVHAFRYEKGTHEIYMGTGGYTIVGIVPIDAPIKVRNAGLSDNSLDKLDWLYQ